MDHLVAFYRGGKIDEIVRRWQGKVLETERKFDRAVIVTFRPDVKVGDPWPIPSVDEAVAAGKLERVPTEADPHAYRLPIPKGGEQ